MKLNESSQISSKLNDEKLLKGQNVFTVKPLNTAVLGTGEKPAVFRKRRYWESCRTNKNLIWDLKMSGGIEGEAVNGGVVLGGVAVYEITCN